jgi:hypothetical protein
MSEVSAALIGEFARRLEALARPDGEATGGTSGTMATDGNSLDVARTVVVPMLRRAAAPVVAGVLSGLAGWWIGRASARSRGVSPY